MYLISLSDFLIPSKQSKNFAWILDNLLPGEPLRSGAPSWINSGFTPSKCQFESSGKQKWAVKLTYETAHSIEASSISDLSILLDSIINSSTWLRNTSVRRRKKPPAEPGVAKKHNINGTSLPRRWLPFWPAGKGKYRGTESPAL